MRFSQKTIAALVALGAQCAAQITSSPYTDPNTGISFQTCKDSRTSFSFGIAVPEANAGTDFIGQMVVPLTASGGWGGISLGAEMVGKLLVVAWPNGDNVMTSFRHATAYANPPEHEAGQVSAVPIANGTFVKGNQLSLTWLCKGCLLGGDMTFQAGAKNAVLGWALSAITPVTPALSSSALTYHTVGSGEFVVDLASAASAKYDAWASWVSVSTKDSSGLASKPAKGSGPSSEPAKGSGLGSGPSTNSTGAQTTPTGAQINSTIPILTSSSTYDVIVVGGGASGIIVAERIAESGASVLLLERGPPNTPSLGSTAVVSWNSSITAYDLPALYPDLGSLSADYCSDTASKSGCLFGGSSSINGINFIHPPEHDFERFPEGWKWADVASAAQRLYERNPGTTTPSADGRHYNDSPFWIMSSLLKGQGWSQVDSIKSPNDKHMVYSRPAWSITTNGTRLRAGPARTYMPFAQRLDNFHVQYNTKVSQLARNRSAITGVYTITADGLSRGLIKLNAGGKMVLAAGALSTPRVLWNSGIGRFNALRIVQSSASSLGLIMPSESDWIDLPVGHHLMDHSQLQLLFNTTPSFAAYMFSAVATSPNKTDLDLWASKNSGPLTQPQHSMHLWTSVRGSDGRKRFLQGTVSAFSDGVVKVGCFLTHGLRSKGELSIDASGNTVLEKKPWLNNAVDKTTLVDFLQWLMDTAQGTGNGSLTVNGTVITMRYTTPGASAESLLADKLVSGDHWVGSARMGALGERVNGTAVVDTNTKVYETDNLFIVDASIHPDLPTGNTQAMVMIIAEHAAQKIIKYKVKSGSARNSTASSRRRKSGSCKRKGDHLLKQHSGGKA